MEVGFLPGGKAGKASALGSFAVDCVLEGVGEALAEAFAEFGLEGRSASQPGVGAGGAALLFAGSDGKGEPAGLLPETPAGREPGTQDALFRWPPTALLELCAVELFNLSTLLPPRPCPSTPAAVLAPLPDGPGKVG